MADEFKKMEDDILEKELRHDENKIDDKRSDIADHEAQIREDKTKFMKDIHAEEIKHDERVIARKENDAERHEEKIKENEQKINDVK
ncbi:hypothetical protein [uncultured Faecalibaculum sp.]|uniref:hypothetical protein n=1 Tax=uncultured Faecalibaculum sp. TaxID=1729681 RepID=UPI0025F2F330|nr:hypothetical protein [uncultured Faecalibaculum sp.]